MSPTALVALFSSFLRVFGFPAAPAACFPWQQCPEPLALAPMSRTWPKVFWNTGKILSGSGKCADSVIPAVPVAWLSELVVLPACGPWMSLGRTGLCGALCSCERCWEQTEFEKSWALGHGTHLHCWPHLEPDFVLLCFVRGVGCWLD